MSAFSHCRHVPLTVGMVGRTRPPKDVHSLITGTDGHGMWQRRFKAAEGISITNWLTLKRLSQIIHVAPHSHRSLNVEEKDQRLGVRAAMCMRKTRLALWSLPVEGEGSVTSCYQLESQGSLPWSPGSLHRDVLAQGDHPRLQT